MDIEKRIETKIAAALTPDELVVRNDSGHHAGHAGDNGTGQTHFHVKVVSEKFSGQGRIARQRMVYDLLEDEFSLGLHALALNLSTPDEEIKRKTMHA